MTKKLKQRLPILGGNPDDRFKVPVEGDFDRVGKDWIAADGAAKIAEHLIHRHTCFKELRGARLAYLWKRKGSEQPKLVLGTCQRPSGLLKYFTDFHFVIWFAANNCNKVGLTNWQMEALVYHELKHADMDGMDPVIVPHDWEGFADEIKHYGFWKNDIRMVADAVGQILLFPYDEPLVGQQQSPQAGAVQ